MKAYVVLKDGDPIESGDINIELWDEYNETKEEAYYHAAREVCYVTLDKDVAKAWLEECESFYEGDFNIGELHLISGELEIN